MNGQHRERCLYRETFRAGQVLAEPLVLQGVIGKSNRIEQRGRGIVRLGPQELEYVDVRIYVERKASR